ncbi:MAG TPA: AgmX/PglI C-terminal domain-containing protein [Labilithrix sp.]|jgi:hypothetical protein
MLQQHAARLPGRMTAVMRAVSVIDNRPRVLRIAVVENGRVAAERIVPEGIVTIGGGEDASFVVRGAGARFRLFERDGAKWRVNVRRGMSGRLALASGITDVAGFEGAVALDEHARGKIVIGETTLLFQLVAPAPIAPKPQLPIAVTGGIADRIDWSLTIVAALSFLFHFGVVGAMYSDWMDPVVDARDASLVDISRVLGHDQPIELPTQPVEPGIATKDPAKDPVATKEPGKPSQTTTTRPNPGPAQPRTSEARAAELARQADAMNMGMIVAINGGPATQAAMMRSEVPPVDMSSAAASRNAVATSNGDLKTPSGGDTQVHRGDLSQLATNTKKDGSDHAGTENTNVAPPIPTVMTLPPTSTGAVTDADAIVAKLRPRFRKCYQDGLSSDPTMHGKVVLNARVGANGEVNGVDVVSNNGLSQPVAACLQATLGRATFTAHGASNVQVPVTFEHQ